MDTLQVGTASTLKLCGVVCLNCSRVILGNHWCMKVTHQEDGEQGCSVGYHYRCVPQKLRDQWILGDDNKS